MGCKLLGLSSAKHRSVFHTACCNSQPSTRAPKPEQQSTKRTGELMSRRRTALNAQENSAGDGTVPIIPDAAGDKESRRKLWMAAIKPPMYSVGFIPVLVS